MCSPAHSHTWLLVGGFSSSLHGHLQMAAHNRTSPKASDHRERDRDRQKHKDKQTAKKEATVLLYHLISEMSHHHLCHVLLVPGALWKNATQGCACQEVGSSGAIMETPSTGDNGRCIGWVPTVWDSLCFWLWLWRRHLLPKNYALSGIPVLSPPCPNPNFHNRTINSYLLHPLQSYLIHISH